MPKPAASMPTGRPPHRWSVLAGVLLALLVLPRPGAASEDDHRVTLSGTFAQERFVAGSTVRVDGATLQDLFATGGEVVMNDTWAEDVIAAGGSLRLQNISVHDLIAAGGEIEVAGQVHGDLIAAGGRVRQHARSVIDGYALLAGGDLDLSGRIAGNLRAAGGRVRLSGTVLGDADIAAGRITLAPGARIAGKLTYRSRSELDIAPDAVVEGGIEHVDVERFRAPLAALIGIGLVVWIVVVIGLTLLGATLHTAIPEVLAGAVATMEGRPWASLGLGFALLVATPVAAGLLLFTLVGIPLALFLYAVYAVALSPALIAAGYWVGMRAAAIFGWSYPGEPILWRVVWTLLGLVILALVSLVPLLGWLVLFIAFALGLGGFALRAARVLTDAGRWPHDTPVT